MIDKDLAEHYTWGNGCDGWHLVNSPDLSIIQERMPAQTAEQRHAHARSRQFFFVLSGTVTMEIEDRREILQSHQGVEIPPGTVHRILNESGHAVEFVVISHPHSHGDRIAHASDRKQHDSDALPSQPGTPRALRALASLSKKS